MPLPRPSQLTVPSRAWSVASYADFAEFAGIGGGAWHFRFRNGAMGHAEDFVLAAVGLGLAAEIPVSWLTSIGRAAVSAFNSFISRAANAAISSYTECHTRRAVCFDDLAYARGMISCAQAGAGIAGASAFGLNVIVPRLGTAPVIEANLSGFSYTRGAGAFAAGGVLVPVGMAYSEEVRQRFIREQLRSPTSPVIRDPGHY